MGGEWEIALLHRRGRLALSRPLDEWLATLRQIENLSFVPLSVDVAVESTRLPGDFHPDPADRMIVALARHLDASLLSADEKILRYPHVKAVW